MRKFSLKDCIFANSAENYPQQGEPVDGKTYRLSDIAQSDVEQGVKFSEVVETRKLNETMLNITKMVDWLEKKGGLLWSDSTNYETGDFCRADDFSYWIALSNSGPKYGGGINPISPDNVNKWKMAEIIVNGLKKTTTNFVEVKKDYPASSGDIVISRFRKKTDFPIHTVSLPRNPESGDRVAVFHVPDEKIESVIGSKPITKVLGNIHGEINSVIMEGEATKGVEFFYSSENSSWNVSRTAPGHKNPRYVDYVEIDESVLDTSTIVHEVVDGKFRFHIVPDGQKGVEKTSTGTRIKVNSREDNLIKLLPDGLSASSSDLIKPPAGIIYQLPYEEKSNNLILCDGRQISRQEYSELFESIGTMYGAGDGYTTFNVPDLRGKFLKGNSESEPTATKLDAGVPNLYGFFGGMFAEGASSVDGTLFRKTSVAFDNAGDHHDHGYVQGRQISFSTGRSNPIYTGKTVAPDNVSCNFYITTGKGNDEDGVEFVCRSNNTYIALLATARPGYQGELVSVVYKKNSGAWEKVYINAHINCNNGDTIKFRATKPQFFSTKQIKYRFFSPGEFECHGNIMYLLYPNGRLLQAYENSFDGLFKDFKGLLTAPDFPAIMVDNNAYNGTFYGCTGLVEPPAELPAGYPSDKAYYEMFCGCIGLRKTSRIYAKNASAHAFDRAFCGSGIESIELDVESFEDAVFYETFKDCKNLKKIAVRATSWGSKARPRTWVEGVPAGGVFICPAELPEEYGISRIPEGWTKQVIEEPEPELNYPGFNFVKIDTGWREFHLDGIGYAIKDLGTRFLLQIQIDGGKWTDYVNQGFAYDFNTDSMSRFFDTIKFRAKSYNPDKDATSLMSFFFYYGTLPSFTIFGDLKYLYEVKGRIPEIPKGFMLGLFFYTVGSNVDASSLIIPSGRIPDKCFYRSFGGVSKSPSFPDATYGNGALEECFYIKNVGSSGSKLKELRVKFKAWQTGTDGELVTKNWVSGDAISETGTFYCPAELPEIHDESHIPVGWTVVRE